MDGLGLLVVMAFIILIIVIFDKQSCIGCVKEGFESIASPYWDSYASKPQTSMPTQPTLSGSALADQRSSMGALAHPSLKMPVIGPAAANLTGKKEPTGYTGISDLPSVPVANLGEVNSLPYQDPRFEKVSTQMLRQLKQDMDGFSANEVPYLKDRSDPEVKLPLTRFKGDYQRVKDELAVVDRTPGFQSQLAVEDLNEMAANLRFLQRTYRLYAANEMVPAPEGGLSKVGIDSVEGFATGAERQGQGTNVSEGFDSGNSPSLIPSFGHGRSEGFATSSPVIVPPVLNPATATLSEFQSAFNKAGCTRKLVEGDLKWWRTQTSSKVLDDMAAYSKLTSTCSGLVRQHNFCSPGKCTTPVSNPATATLSEFQTAFNNAGCTRTLVEGDLKWWRTQTSSKVLDDMAAYSKITSTCSGLERQHNFCSPGKCTTPALNPATATLSEFQSAFNKAGCTRTLVEGDLKWWRTQTSSKVLDDMAAYSKFTSTCSGLERQHNFCSPGKCTTPVTPVVPVVPSYPTDPANQPISVSELNLLRQKLAVEILRLQASGTTDPVLNARVNVFKKIQIAIEGISTQVQAGSMRPQDIPIRKRDYDKFLPALGDQSAGISGLLSNTGYPSLSSLFNAYDRGDVTGAQLSQNLFKHYADTLLQGLSYKMDISYTSPNEVAARQAEATKAAADLANSTVGNQVFAGLSGAFQTTHPMTFDGARGAFDAYTRELDMQGFQGELNLGSQGLPDGTYGRQPVIPSSAQAARFDWKERAQTICDNVKKMGMNPADFGCQPNPQGSAQNTDFSWRGYSKMVCNRLKTVADPGVPEQVGCPPDSWRGWRT